METRTSAGAEDLLRSKDRLVKDIGGMVNQASDVLKNYGTRKLQTAKETLSHTQDVVGDRAKQYAGITEEYVRANPWTSVSVAAAAGLLVGILLTRR